MAYGTFCPGPSHILKTKHPKYAPETTYEQYKNGFPADFMNIPVMGAWAPVAYRPDDIIVLRRNPYYWKVDEAGNQLPYLNEVHYKLSTWADRDVQTIAGSADFSNLEQPENFVEALKRAAEETAPARLAFGPARHRLQSLPQLLRQWLGRARRARPGDPRAEPQPRLPQGGHHGARPQGSSASRWSRDRSPPSIPAACLRRRASTTGRRPSTIRSTSTAPRRCSRSAGLKDTDGNGFVNFPADKQGGKDVEIMLLSNSDYTTDKNLAEGVIGQMEKLGIRVILNSLDGKQFDATRYAGKFDWMVRRNEAELRLGGAEHGGACRRPVRAPAITTARRKAAQLDLMPFEQELVDIVNKFIASSDDAERAELMKQYQKIATTNIDTIGLTEYPGALIINKRFANIPVGAPIFMFNWAEDTIIRERVFVPEDKQADFELFKETLPGKPGVGEGPAT